MKEFENSPSPASSLRHEPEARSSTPLDLFGSMTTLVEKTIRQSANSSRSLGRKVLSTRFVIDAKKSSGVDDLRPG